MIGFLHVMAWLVGYSVGIGLTWRFAHERLRQRCQRTDGHRYCDHGFSAALIAIPWPMGLPALLAATHVVPSPKPETQEKGHQR